MEDSYISVQLRVDNESVSRHNLATEYLLVSATEEAPRSWIQAPVSIFDPAEFKCLVGYPESNPLYRHRTEQIPCCY